MTLAASCDGRSIKPTAKLHAVGTLVGVEAEAWPEPRRPLAKWQPSQRRLAHQKRPAARRVRFSHLGSKWTAAAGSAPGHLARGLVI